MENTSSKLSIDAAPGTPIGKTKAGTPSPLQPFLQQLSSTSKSCNYSCAFKTPAKISGCSPSGVMETLSPVGKLRTPSGNRMHTPVSSISRQTTPRLESGLRIKLPPRFVTPSSGEGCTSCRSIIMNPFESALFDQLHQPTFSPGMFSTKLSTPSSGGSVRPFCWSIDQMADLHPADIDEMPLQQDTLSIVDPEAEKSAQAAIDKFFSSKSIVPSPWSTGPRQKPFMDLKESPLSANSIDVVCPCCCDQGDKSVKEDVKISVETVPAKKDAVCQTALSLPVDFDLEKILGECEYYNKERCNSICVVSDEAGQDAMSTSTLRRKLFFQGDLDANSSRQNAMDDNEDEVDGVQEDIIPGENSHLNVSTPAVSNPSLLSAQFSSSPIGNGVQMNHINRRCSNGLAVPLTSPELSPIGGQSLHNSSKEIPSRMSFLDMPPTCTPLVMVSGPLQGTPSSGRQTIPLASPGMSPIGDQNNQPSPLGNSRKSSPIQALSFHDDGEEDNEAVTSCSDQTFVSQINFDLSCEENKENLPVLDTEYIDRREHRQSVMEVDGANFDNYLNKNGEDLNAREFPLMSTMMEIDNSHVMSSHDNHKDQPLVKTNQDTGYQTASLQLTNQDTSLHTNLTNYFNNVGIDTPHLKANIKEDHRKHYIQDDSLIMRAKNALARAKLPLGESTSNNYQQFAGIEHGINIPCQKNSSQSTRWQPSSASTPYVTKQSHYREDMTKQSHYREDMTKQSHYRENVTKQSHYREEPAISQLPSEVVINILKKAGDDFERFRTIDVDATTADNYVSGSGLTNN